MSTVIETYTEKAIEAKVSYGDLTDAKITPQGLNIHFSFLFNYTPGVEYPLFFFVLALLSKRIYSIFLTIINISICHTINCSE